MGQLSWTERNRMTIRRMNWGCGQYPVQGWVNADIIEKPGIDISCDIRDGLPLPDNSLDYIVSIHALQDIPYLDINGTLKELRRVLTPGGVLRLSLPDLDKAIDAYRQNDRDYFLIDDDEHRSLGGKLIVHLLWYGITRTLFTYDFIEELLTQAGFSSVQRCEFKETSSPYNEIVELDNRERESLFVEAVK